MHGWEKVVSEFGLYYTKLFLKNSGVRVYLKIFQGQSGQTYCAQGNGAWNGCHAKFFPIHHNHIFLEWEEQYYLTKFFANITASVLYYHHVANNHPNWVASLTCFRDHASFVTSRHVCGKKIIATSIPSTYRDASTIGFVLHKGLCFESIVTNILVFHFYVSSHIVIILHSSRIK